MMTRLELLRKIEAIANLNDGTLTGEEPLEEIDDWDSLAVLSVLALFDKEFGVVLQPVAIYECPTANALIDLVKGHVTA